MWMNLALAVALTSGPAQADQLTISNIRAIYGILGAPRPDNKILPGDKYIIAFEVDGVKINEDGKVSYTLAMDVSDKNGKLIYSQAPKDQEAYLSLGGSKLPASMFIVAKPDEKAGIYSIKVTVADKTSKASQTFTREVEVLPREFGIVHLFTTADPGADYPSPPSGVTGQYLHLNFGVVGFERKNTGDKQPDVSVEMRILDENGKQTVKKPFTGVVNDRVPANIVGLTMQFNLALNRPGKFTIELKATDNVANKTAKKVTLPLTVVEQKTGNSE